ncbi:MAG: DUF1284 domain-containing protein [Nanoarchaeota archaeon]
MTTIRLRPHHLPAIEDYMYKPEETVEGLKNCGYTSEYIENERSTIWKILTERDCMVEIIDSIDDLCKPCKPKRKRCFENDPEEHRQYMENLGLEVGHTYSGRDIITRIQDNKERISMFREAARR